MCGSVSNTCRSAAIVLTLAVLAAPLAWPQTECPGPQRYWRCPAEWAPGTPKPGGFVARIQGRLSHTQSDPGQPTWLLRDDRSANDDYNTRRLRLAYSGQTSDDMLYFGHLARDWGADEFEILDLYVTFGSGDRPKVSVGQMSTPFDRQFLTSDVRLPLAHRARTTVLLVPARDIGVLAHDAECTERLGWYAGLFTGNGRNELDFDEDIMPVARVEWLASPNLNVGANWARKPHATVSNFSRFMGRNGDPYGLQPLYGAERLDEEMWGIDFLYRRGPTAAWGGYTAKEVSGAGASVDAEGWHLELTHAIDAFGTPESLDLTLGYEDFDPNDAVVDQLDARWLTVGGTWHIKGCERQVRLQYVHRDERAMEVDNDSIVLQYEHIFR